MNVEKNSAEMWQSLDPASVGAGTYMESIVTNLRAASSAYSRAYYLIVLLVIFFWLIVRGGIREVSFASVGLNDVAALRWLIPAAMSAAYYYATSAFALELHLLAVMDEYYRVHAPLLISSNLVVLSYPPSFFNMERVNAKVFRTRTSIAGGAVVGIAVLIVPSVLLVAVMYANFVERGAGLSGILQKLLFGMTLLLLARTLILLVEVIRNK
jgi:hypothetical protein